MDNINWQALEFHKHKKSPTWFAALWIVVGALVVVAVLTKSILMAILVILGGLVVSLFAIKDPREFTFVLNEKILAIDNTDYPLEDFASFWIFEEEEHNVLSLMPAKTFKTRLKIILPKEHTSNARLFLRAAVEEEEHQESLVEALADWLGF